MRQLWGRRLGGSRRRGAAAVVVAILTATLAGTGTPSQAWGPPVMTGRAPVAPGLVREAYRWTSPHGRVVFQVLRFRRDDPRVVLKPELGRGEVPGREPTHLTLARLGESAVAGVNGSFRSRSPGPDGDPEGLFVRDGAYISDPQLKGRAWRGGFALFPGGGYAVAPPDDRGDLRLPDGSTAPISGLNRFPAAPREGFPDETELTLLTRDFAASTRTPRGTVEVTLPAFRAAMNTDVPVTVAAVSTAGNTPIPAGGAVLSATGGIGRRLAALGVGDVVEIELHSTAGWDAALQAVSAGPTLIADGRYTPQASWFDEGFGEHHNLKTHPRTVVGFRADGEMLLVSVDGRRPGHSVGLTTAGAAHLMAHLGAVDAVMMDGGGSTTMAVDDRIVNRPCCDRAGFRAVSNSLVVHSTVRTPQVLRLPGQVRYTVAAATAYAGWPDGAPTVVVAHGGVFTEMLAAGPLAARLGAPLLLTGRDGLPPQTTTALERLKTRSVVVVGGASSVSDAVVSQLRGRGLAVSRIAGRDPTQTAAAIALRLGAPGRRVLLASASSWPEAVSAAVPSAVTGTPLLLTWNDRLSEHTASVLRRLGVVEVVIVGGPGAVGDTVASELRRQGYRVGRIAGKDRYATSVALAEWAARAGRVARNRVVLATGADFPDALVAAPFGARHRMAVVLTNPRDLGRAPAVHAWLDAQPLRVGFLTGSRGVVATWVAHQLQAEIND